MRKSPTTSTMRWLSGLLAVCFVVASIASAEARCVCRCVNGEVQPICESAIDLPPIRPRPGYRMASQKTLWMR